MAKNAVEVKHLSKSFKLPHEKVTSLKAAAVNWGKRSYEQLHVLEDINFEVKQGEFFGIVGRNGSGKSTLLKLLAGIYAPTAGSLKINGRLTPFIELGVGFNMELSGRDNVFLNGILLGLTRDEVKRKYDTIVEFAELEKFMDQKLKNYSSGMQVRLAFSIAIQAHAEILLVDEVLAVGDANFQRKCFNVFKQIKGSGKTVIFISHDMGAVQEYCDRAMMIQDGQIIKIGKPREIALRYEVANAVEARNKTSDDTARPSHPAVHIDALKLRGTGKEATLFRQDDDIVVDIDYTVNADTEPVQFNLYLVRPDGTYLAGMNTTGDLGKFSPKLGKHRLSCTIESGQLVHGDYVLNVGVYTHREPAKLIDALDSSYGADVPYISVIDVSPTQNGEFNMRGHWAKSAKEQA